MADILQDLNEAYEQDTAAWADIRREAAEDMKYVSGDPWTAEDKTARKNRPTVAPEEMGQYFNQVINALWAHPIGIKCAPVGNGANDQGAEFYQNKFREIEYRSHANVAYVQAAENAIQRGYGFVRVSTRYASPRSANQEIWIEGFPDPDMVLPDPAAKKPDSSDMQHCFVLESLSQREFKRLHPQAKIHNFSDFASSHQAWIQGDRVIRAEYWAIETTPRKLLLVQPPPPALDPMGRPLPPLPPVQLFEDEVPRGATVIRALRTVDSPHVKQYLTNGLEILSETDWPGKYIPIVSCYGKVIYVPEGGDTKRKILSMTRFGRDPWKAYCYACSQELEILAMVPKAPLMVAKGQMDPAQLEMVKRSMHEPVAALTYNATIPELGNQLLGRPERADYVQAQYLQAIEIAKEGFRRAIQAAMGSNFLPTQAQRRNEKSGVALDKISEVAAQGTYHFVNSQHGMVRQVGVISEDLIPHFYDYSGETGVILPDQKAQIVVINTPANEKAVSTKGDYVVTISTAPSSDSQREAADDFTDTLVARLPDLAQIAGPKPAAAILAMAVRMRNLGARGDQIADLIEPAEYKHQEGQPPPDPQVQAAQQQIQQLTQQLQQMGMVIQTKQIEGKIKYEIERMKVDATSEDKAADREVKLAVAAIGAELGGLKLFVEERARLGDQAQAATQAALDRLHEHLQGTMAHQRAMALQPSPEEAMP